MKIVRLRGGTVIEVIPETIPFDEIADYYNADFAAQCVEAPDEVEQHWRYIDGAWSEPEPPPPPLPSPDDRLTSLEAENKLLKAQNQALADQQEFLEDVITELILTVVP